MTLRIEKLRRDHRVEGFDCGKEPLNRFLIRFALQSQLSNSSQTYLAFSQDEVVGFYTLAFGDVTYEDAPERLRKGVARHPIPLMILARLAVASTWAGKRIGSGLLTRSPGRSRRPRSPAFGPSQSTPRMMRCGPSTNASTSSLRPAIPCICSCC